MEAHAATRTAAAHPGQAVRLPGVGAGLGRGTVVLYLSLIVLLPLAALSSASRSAAASATSGTRSPRRWRSQSLEADRRSAR